jgi:hypothetical protein
MPDTNSTSMAAEEPEQQLLAPVVLAHLRHVVVVAVDHLLGPLDPFPVGLAHAVEALEAEEHHHEEQHHHDPDEGVQDARPGPPPNSW